jgi:hypothetical protein
VLVKPEMEKSVRTKVETPLWITLFGFSALDLKSIKKLYAFQVRAFKQNIF